MFSKLCTVVADTALAAKSLSPQRNSTGRSYYAQTFYIIFLFGLTEIKAQLGWVENVRAYSVHRGFTYEYFANRESRSGKSFISTRLFMDANNENSSGEAKIVYDDDDEAA